ncbi:hypothetical protein C8F01DRAFT_1148021 [Mycena amicta]|nr:hypothetical protein C8F01DRAFT_1148021 [Mycena amicta]
MSESDIPRNASSPFPSPTSFPATSPADLILRSSDGVDFFVHKQLLSMLSGFFHGMFTAPYTSAGDSLLREGIPVLSVTEPESVLYTVLRIAYPSTSLTPYPVLTAENIDDLIHIHRAADKYQFSLVEQVLLVAAKADLSKLLASNPVRLFVIAGLCGTAYAVIASEALHSAARDESLSPQLAKLSFPEMRQLTWSQGKEIERLCLCYREFIASTLQLQLGGTNFRFKHIEPLGNRNVHFRRRYTDIVFVWWRPENHAESCLSTHSTFGREKRIAAKKPYQTWILNVSVLWFQKHVKKLENHLQFGISSLTTEAPTTDLLDLSPDVQKLINGCKLCSLHAKEHLKDWAEQVGTDVLEINKYLDTQAKDFCAQK